ncbi:MAG TPA: DedA family protein [Planctomycetes bacterium]|nr:DedA family protein [Planctomycetota bacterium]
MIACGIGIPFPEELILVGAGYIVYLDKADPLLLAGTCIGAILAGDLMPFLLGRVFGPKILRLKTVRRFITREKLALFDAWFQKRGWLTIFVARFLTGLRMPAYFTAGSMRFSAWRFLMIDGLGALLVVPLLGGLGYLFGDKIDSLVHFVEKTERGIFIVVASAAVLFAGWIWFRRHRRKSLLGKEVKETFVGPDPSPNQLPPRKEADEKKTNNKEKSEKGAEETEKDVDMAPPPRDDSGIHADSGGEPQLPRTLLSPPRPPEETEAKEDQSLEPPCSDR